MHFQEYDAIRLQNYVRDPKKMGIPAKVGSKAGDNSKPEKKKVLKNSASKNKYA